MQFCYTTEVVLQIGGVVCMVCLLTTVGGCIITDLPLCKSLLVQVYVLTSITLCGCYYRLP